jgi:hypothetical protein
MLISWRRTWFFIDVSNFGQIRHGSVRYFLSKLHASVIRRAAVSEPTGRRMTVMPTYNQYCKIWF